MNYQGTTYKSFLIVLPIMLLPMLIVGVLSAFTSLTVALSTLILLGLTGILLRNQLITLCVNQFNRRKYKLAEGFREKL
jgi:multidrug efflux pump subunit AcrB